jgi:hypothetical protein
MWNNSTQIVWQCNGCDYTSEYPMRECENCDCESISRHETDYSGGQSDWEDDDNNDYDD